MNAPLKQLFHSMKDKKVYVLLEDDTEIFGNGSGHVMSRMYLPVVRYIDILKKYGAKSTFYVDMAHWLFLRKNPEFEDFDVQADIIEKTILHILENNMEVQLHLHSQWVNAKIVDNGIYVTEKWSIGQLTAEEQKNLFQEGSECLKKIITKSKKQNSLNSFKAGSWGLQPFNVLYDELKDKGIKIVMGPTKGLKVTGIQMDYSLMESEITPYYCRKDEINKISDKKDIAIIPMTPTYLNWIDLVRYVFHVKYTAFVKKFDDDLDLYKVPKKMKFLNPLSNRDSIHSLTMPYKTNLKMNKQPFWYLKKTFKRAFKYVQKNNFDYKLMVLETHTKDFKNTFDDIDRFFQYLTKNYENIEFVTASDLVRHLNEGKLKPLCKE